jgi:hypothetical protein
MLRLKAELMLQTGHPPEGVENLLHEASRISREQDARSAQLRIAIDLGRLWAARSEIEQAKRLVDAARRGVEEGPATPSAVLRTLDHASAREFPREVARD